MYIIKAQLLYVFYTILSTTWHLTRLTAQKIPRKSAKSIVHLSHLFLLPSERRVHSEPARSLTLEQWRKQKPDSDSCQAVGPSSQEWLTSSAATSWNPSNFSSIKKKTNLLSWQDGVEPNQESRPSRQCQFLLSRWRVKFQPRHQEAVLDRRWPRVPGVDLGRDLLTNRSAGSCGHDVGRLLALRLEVYAFDSRRQLASRETAWGCAVSAEPRLSLNSRNKKTEQPHQWTPR